MLDMVRSSCSVQNPPDSLYDPVQELLTASTEVAFLEYNKLDKESRSLADEQAGEGESALLLL
jgi:hypothetical protein